MSEDSGKTYKPIAVLGGRKLPLSVQSGSFRASGCSTGPVVGALTLPNGKRIKTVREDAFRAALAASRAEAAR